MFPYVCLATLPLFCEEDWPEKLKRAIFDRKWPSKTSKNMVCAEKYSEEKTNISWKHRLVVGLLLTYCTIQTFLPFSHSITKVSK